MRGRSRWRQVACALLVGLGVAAPCLGTAATITVISGDDPGEGFNDPTPVSPVGGNKETTLGRQRLIAVQYAARLWGDLLESDVEIRVAATFDPLPCDGDSVVLGSAGPNCVHRNFAGALEPDTFYPDALANKLAGMDLCPPGACPQDDDISATFNSSLGTTCLSFGRFYLGLDAKPPEGDVDLVTTVLHELGHGLGFITFIDLETGAKFLGADDAYMRYLEDHRTGRLFPNMSNAERLDASTGTGDLHWVGPHVVAASGRLIRGADPSGHVEMYAPPFIEGGASVSHFSDELEPDEVMEPRDTGPLHDVGLALELFADIGWRGGEPATFTPTPAPATPTRTRTPTVTVSRTATRTPTATVTPGVGSPTPTRTANAACVGDCDGDLTIAVNELVTGIDIALDRVPFDACPQFDLDGDGRVGISELVTAVGNAVDGCPEIPPTPAHTPTTTPTRPPSACPFDFRDNSLAAGVLCIFRGRWNGQCGDEALGVTLVGDGEQAVAAVATEPVVFLGGEVTSPTAVALFGSWLIDPSVDLELVEGTMELADDGQTLIIDPVGAPFAVDGCDFEEYVGVFAGTASPSPGG